MTKIADLKLVVIWWLDAASTTDDIKLNDSKKFTPVPRVNVGWIMSEDAEKITLCSRFFLYDDKTIEKADISCLILTGMIESIEKQATVEIEKGHITLMKEMRSG